MNNTNSVFHSLTKGQIQALLHDPKLGTLSEEKVKEISDEITDTILKRIFLRIAHVLTSDDMEELKELDKNDASGNTVRYFLLSKVANVDAIIAEEIQFFKEEITGEHN